MLRFLTDELQDAEDAGDRGERRLLGRERARVSADGERRGRVDGDTEAVTGQPVPSNCDYQLLRRPSPSPLPLAVLPPPTSTVASISSSAEATTSSTVDAATTTAQAATTTAASATFKVSGAGGVLNPTAVAEAQKKDLTATRAAAGDQVIMFSCGGCGDGSGQVQSAQLFPFTAANLTAPYALTPENAKGVANNNDRLSNVACDPTAADQFFTIGSGSASATGAISIPAATAVSTTAAVTTTQAAATTTQAATTTGASATFKVSGAGGVLNPTAAAESHPKDTTATRAATVYTLDLGQAMSLRRCDFHENLISITIKTYDGSDGQKGVSSPSPLRELDLAARRPRFSISACDPDVPGHHSHAAAVVTRLSRGQGGLCWREGEVWSPLVLHCTQPTHMSRRGGRGTAVRDATPAGALKETQRARPQPSRRCTAAEALAGSAWVFVRGRRYLQLGRPPGARLLPKAWPRGEGRSMWWSGVWNEAHQQEHDGARRTHKKIAPKRAPPNRAREKRTNNDAGAHSARRVRSNASRIPMGPRSMHPLRARASLVSDVPENFGKLEDGIFDFLQVLCQTLKWWRVPEPGKRKAARGMGLGVRRYDFDDDPEHGHGHEHLDKTDFCGR
ncbi:hypothetical protein FB451DRAFT_1163014 [Mycena latifolia]|nr:hypothetical protein FB451DRAFT_1163014 [Mycena latifolia]